jgi:F-type H+-transporting ATPase subunit b
MLKLITLILTATEVQAAGGGGSISDLILPAWNFVPLFIVMVILLRKPIVAGFTKNAEDVESLYNLAEEKDKEAQIKLDMYEKKMSSLKVETEKLMTDAKSEAERIATETISETEGIVAKMSKDADVKVAYEKDQALREINASLVDEVISKAKTKIKENKDFKSKATDKLVAEI